MTAIAKPEMPVFDTAPDDLKPVLETLATALAEEPDWAARKDSLLEVLMAVDGMTALTPGQQGELARVMEQVETGAMSQEDAERALEAIAADLDGADDEDGDGDDEDGEAAPPPDLLPMFIGAILERLDEDRIACAEQAGFYLLSVQPEHVEAAETWLEAAPENADALRALLEGDAKYATLFDLLLAPADGEMDDDDDDFEDGFDEGFGDGLPDAANDDVPGGGRS